MTNETIRSDRALVADYLAPVSNAKEAALQMDSAAHAIHFSSLSSNEKIQRNNGNSYKYTSQYGSMLTRDLANFTTIAKIFAEKDAQMGRGG